MSKFTNVESGFFYMPREHAEIEAIRREAQKNFFGAVSKKFFFAVNGSESALALNAASRMSRVMEIASRSASPNCFNETPRKTYTLDHALCVARVEIEVALTNSNGDTRTSVDIYYFLDEQSGP
jgi:hypothetical protein